MYEITMSQGPSLRERDWVHDALCQNEDPSIFTLSDRPEDRQLNKDNFEKAEEICAKCPVFMECWESATDVDKKVTMRAGAWPEEYREPKKKKTREWGFCAKGHDLSLPGARRSPTASHPEGECAACDRERGTARRKRARIARGEAG